MASRRVANLAATPVATLHVGLKVAGSRISLLKSALNVGRFLKRGLLPEIDCLAGLCIINAHCGNGRMGTK